MQDCLVLKEEIMELAQSNIADGLSVITSIHEDWNPIAAVLLHGLKLPTPIEPKKLDVRIPVPDLYAFATSASVVLTQYPLYERLGPCETVRVPFCRVLLSQDVKDHRNYFVDLREQSDWQRGMYYLCITPTVDPKSTGFSHFSLMQFVGYLLDYLSGPIAILMDDLRYSKSQWKLTNDAWWLLRIGHIYEGLREFSNARSIFLKGKAFFPKQKEFSMKLRRLRLIEAEARRNK